MKRLLTVCLLSLSLSLSANNISTWNSPVTLSSSGVDSSNPQIGLDGSGNTVAVWLEGGTTIKANTLPVGMSWGTPTILSSSATSGAQLAVDLAGNATAIWVESGAIKTKTMPAGMAWGSVTTLASSGNSSPQVSVEPTTGDIVAVWVNGTGTSAVVQSETKPAGMSWTGTVHTLSSSGSTTPQVALTYDGTNVNVAAVWQTLNGVTSLFNVNATTTTIAAGSWPAASTVSNTNINSVYPHIAVDLKGNADAIWFTYNYDATTNIYSNVILQSSYLKSGSTWQTPVNLSSGGVRNPAEFGSIVQFAPQGQVYAVWTISFDHISFEIETAQTDLDINWLPSNAFVANLYGYAGGVAQNPLSVSAVNPLSAAFGTYMTSDGMGNIVISTAESEVGGANAGSFTVPVVISSGSENGFPLNSTVLNGGTNWYGGVIWINNNGTNNVIQTSFGTGSPVVPPSSVMVSQSSTNFGVFTEYFNTVSWSASSDPNLTGYFVYRNGGFVGFVLPDAMPLQYIDHNSEPGGLVSYGVSATDVSGSESAVIPVTFP